MRYNKLVRDFIPRIIEAKGETCTYHIADDKEYRQKLLEKLQEELDEFIEHSSIEELADLQQVIFAVLDERGWSRDDFLKSRLSKLRERGSFSQHLILDEA